MKKNPSLSEEEYRKHQIDKKDVKWEYGKLREKEDFPVFIEKYEKYSSFIGTEDADILCLGARFGAEVRALRELGFRKAFGIDIADYNLDGDLVRFGDFMNLEFADASFDFLYSNALDHTHDFEKFLQGVFRVLKIGGHVLFDIWNDWNQTEKHPFWHWHIWAPDSLQELLSMIETAGGVIEACDPIERPFFGHSVIARKSK